MTRLEQAFRWWRNNTSGEPQPIPFRHFQALSNAGFMAQVNEDGEYGLNEKGQRALKRKDDAQADER